MLGSVLPSGKRKVCQQFTGWIGGDHGKRIPATALARQIC